MVTPDNYNPKEYKPSSCFFADYTKLATASTAIETIKLDSFGPVPTGLDSANKLIYSSSQYRTTSFVRATDATPVKVLAVCAGRILIQPSTASGKVNIILIPKDGISSLRIKYFVYRNVTKDDLLLSSTTMQKTDSNTFTAEHPAPEMLMNIWDNYTKSNKGVTPPTLDSVNIGYNESATGDTLIDAYLANLLKGGACRIYDCKAGEHLGYFTEKLGLDVVLDYGDCVLDYQTQSFNLNLAYARESEHVFNTSTVTGDSNIKRYQEYILQFMDAAAFWGSHINCGVITLAKNVDVNSVSEVYTNVLNRFQTASKQYIYITEERGRSYGYYDALGSQRTVSFELTSGTFNSASYASSSWPILIKEFAFSGSVAEKSTAYGYLQYNIAPSIVNEKHISMDVFAPDDADPIMYYPHKYEPDVTGSTQKTDLIEFPIHVNNGANLCANFLLISCNLVQTAPLENYFNHLFPARIIPSNYSTTDTDGYTKWGIYDRNRMVNLLPVFDLGAKMYNKVVTDTQNGVRRRLYMSIIKENTKQTSSLASAQYQKLNVTPGAPGANQISTADKYAVSVYGDTNFSVYRGKFTDTALTATDKTVYSLSLINTDDFEAKKSFFQLGITEEEYTRLKSNTSFPANIGNVFFKLKEIYTTEIQNNDYRKFELGYTYEDLSDNTINPIYPSNTCVYVYTMDGFYFFSAAYSASQAYCSKFANVTVNFRPLVVDNTEEETIDGTTYLHQKNLTETDSTKVYNGEFGFDYLRVGDNNIGNYKEIPYAQIIVNGYRPQFENTVGDLLYKIGTSENEWDPLLGVSNGIETICGINSYKALLRDYNVIPTLNENFVDYVITSPTIRNYTILSEDQINVRFPKIYTQYYIPYLNLFSKEVSDAIASEPNIVTAPPYQANLRVVINKTNANDTYNFEFEYNAELFGVVSCIENETSTEYYSTVTITCNKSFDTNQQIRVWAYLKTESEENKKLAGYILLGANDYLYQKKMKVVCIPVSLNPTGTSICRPEIITDEYKIFLQKLHYQNFLISTVENYEKSSDNTDDIDSTSYDGVSYFNLENDSNLKVGGTFIKLNSFTKEPEINYKSTSVNGQKLFYYLKDIFLQRNGNLTKYVSFESSTIYAFFFGENSDDIRGYSNLGSRGVILFAAGFDTPATFPHETFHSMAITHSFRDYNAILVSGSISDYMYQPLDLDKYQKYVYIKEVSEYKLTNNNLSYNPLTDGSTRSSTWKWQWNIINKEVKNL